MAEDADKRRLGIEFTADVYKVAGVERAGALQALYDAGQYVLAIYVAGVAVESMLRAYRVKVDPAFSSRHDLYELANEARFVEHVPAGARENYAADLTAVALRWANNHRYRSESALRKRLKAANLDRRVKGDFLKENARLAVNASLNLVTLGERRWTN
jgi:hypothetical protein